MELVPQAKIPEHEPAYYAALEADKDWTVELERVFGNDDCNARYEPRGKATPELARLHAAKRTADDRLQEIWRNLRSSPPFCGAENEDGGASGRNTERIGPFEQNRVKYSETFATPKEAE